MMQRWILPCNNSIYNVVQHFKQTDTLFWRVTSATNIDDIVYIYVGKPYSEIMFKCHIKEVNIAEEIIKNSKVAFLTLRKSKKKYARICLDEAYLSKSFPYSELIKHGLKSVQSQMQVSEELINYLEYSKGNNNA